MSFKPVFVKLTYIVWKVLPRPAPHTSSLKNPLIRTQIWMKTDPQLCSQLFEYEMHLIEPTGMALPF